jgi:Zn-dependent protease with chaperone function
MRNALLSILLLPALASSLPVKEQRPASVDPHTPDWGPIFVERLFNVFERVQYRSTYPQRQATVLEYFPREGQTQVPREFLGAGAIAFSPRYGLNRSERPVIVATNEVFRMARDEDELAFVVAHEFAHLELGHHERIKAGTGALFDRWYDRLSEEEKGRPGLAARFRAENLAALDALQQPMEDEADERALPLMHAAGYRRSRAPSAMLHAQDLTWAMGWTPGGDHAPPVQRAENLRRLNHADLERRLGQSLPPDFTPPAE